MKVEGHQIPAEVVDEAVAAMKRYAVFRCFDIQSVIVKRLAEVPSTHRLGVAHRTADRLIQRERKAGRIGPMHGNKRSPDWRWIGKAQ